MYTRNELTSFQAQINKMFMKLLNHPAHVTAYLFSAITDKHKLISHQYQFYENYVKLAKHRPSRPRYSNNWSTL